MIESVHLADRLTSELIQSDRAYFAAGARSDPIRGGTIRWMAGLQHLAAGCIVEPTDSSADPRRLAQDAEAMLQRIGSPFFRCYVPGFPIANVAGFECTTELAMVRSTHATETRPTGVAVPHVRLRPVREGSDWVAKRKLAEALQSLPDGKSANAKGWTELENRKAKGDYGRFWLAELDEQYCATFGLVKWGSVMRLKNLAVHPRFRRRGVGAAIIAAAIERANQSGCDWLGAFAIAGSGGEFLYRHCGLKVVGAQTEWLRPRFNLAHGIERVPCRPALPC
jgi:GNAT superfamily N-acetyltransferase